MINKIIEFSCKNGFIIISILFITIILGIWSIYNTALDAIPDVSDNQVIVFTEWNGRAPQIIEDQITYPLVSNLQGLPSVKAVRGTSDFGFSMVYVIFEDNVNIYWARTRVLEKLSYIQNVLPKGVSPTLGPDGTGLGHVYWYTVEGKGYNLGDLRSIQDWYIRYQLSSVPGVSEVASIGGFVKQYQIDLNPDKLIAYHLDIDDIVQAVQKSNNEVGGKIIEYNDQEYFIRGQGYVKGIRDLEEIVVKVEPDKGIPVYLKDVAYIQMGGDIRRGLLEKNGNGEVVGGIVVARYGTNAREVINNVKAKIKEIEKGLPEGVKIKTAYDRSDLIERSVDTLKHTLKEELIIVSIIILLFLFDIRSAIIVIFTLPVSIIIAFILMKQFGVTSNIMSLGGIAIAIGVIVDSAIVMVENCNRHLSEKAEEDQRTRFQIILDSARQVGQPIFFSLIIIILSFVPVFFLTGQEGKLFMPLAFTKTFSMTGAAILSITVVPVLMLLILRGKLLPESNNPVSRFCIYIYKPILSFFLKSWVSIPVIILLIILTPLSLFYMVKNIGSEFMPPLDEGSILFMPTTLPNVSITEAKRIVELQDKIIKSHPEVKLVLGKVGRAETATDPAPLSMIETIIILKPKSQWRKGITKNDIIAELNKQLKIPGVSNAWTQPIINRINMLSTGVRTDLAVKIFGDNLNTLGGLALEAEKILKPIPGISDLLAERVMGGKYIDIDIDREAIARYGLLLSKVQDFIETGIGGMNISTTVEGRARYPIRVRFSRDFRDSVGALNNLKMTMPDRSMHIPLSQLSTIRMTSGPPMINSENSLLRSVVSFNVRGRDMGSVIKEAKEKLERNLKLPQGYYISWSGQYEHKERAQKSLTMIIPIVLLIIIILLYLTFNSIIDSLLVIISVPFAIIGGLILQTILGYNFSVAVAVGYIALFGIAVETGVIMLIYLNEALNKRIDTTNITKEDIYNATIEGAALRLRPKLMTVFAALLGLIPIMWSNGTGADLMKPIATPMIGGILTSSIMVLLIIPMLFLLIKTQLLKLNLLHKSTIKH